MNFKNIAEMKAAPERPGPGYYVVVINQVTDCPEKEYLRLQLDVAEGDSAGYNGYQETMWNRRGNKPKDAFVSYKPSAARFAAAFRSALELSNPSFKWADAESTADLVGLIVGAKLAGTEKVYKGTAYTEIAVAEWLPADNARGVQNEKPVTPAARAISFDDELPF